MASPDPLIAPPDPIKAYTLEVYIYSPDDGHWSLVICPTTSPSGLAYNVRSDELLDDDRFFYEERLQHKDGQGVWGRSVLCHLSEAAKARVEASIRDFAAQDRNMPRLSRGENCQTFVVGALARLERDGLLEAGDGEVFGRLVHVTGREIATELEAAGRSWIPGLVREVAKPDAAWSQSREKLQPGRLNVAAWQEVLTSKVVRPDVSGG